MYDELEKQCRDCIDCLCGECKYEHLQKPGNFVSCMNALLGEAADAIEELQQIAVHYEETAKDYFNDVCYHLERMPKWIPVTERLPENGYYVLVYEDGDVVMASYSYSDGKWYLRDMYEIIELKPTHWMPLPQPPKEG